MSTHITMTAAPGCSGPPRANWLVAVLLSVWPFTAPSALRGQAPVDAASASAEAACQGLVPAAVGGPLPANSVLSLRWLGTANYELVYGETVVLLDAYFDRGPRSRPIGITPEAITRADLIVIGHGHFDHISDAAAIARRTNAVVVGDTLSTQVVQRLGLPVAQTRTVTGRGGEILRFKRFTVEPIRARHSTLSEPVIGKFVEAIQAVIGPRSSADSVAEVAIEARGSEDPRVLTDGTLAYLFTFESGFRLLFLDSAGPITDEERRVMSRIRRTDIAIVAYQAQYVAEAQIAATLPLITLFQPAVYLPAHHDEIPGLFLDLGLEPLFLAMRDSLPETRPIAPLYRTPLCFGANSPRR